MPRQRFSPPCSQWLTNGWRNEPGYLQARAGPKETVSYGVQKTRQSKCNSDSHESSWAAQTVKNNWLQSSGWEDPLEKEMATHSSILAWKTHGQRSLAGCSPWGHKESDTTEQHTHTHRHDSHMPPKAVTWEGRKHMGTRRGSFLCCVSAALSGQSLHWPTIRGDMFAGPSLSTTKQDKKRVDLQLKGSIFITQHLCFSPRDMVVNKIN